MTTHKGFKRLVRERMARTGERYSTARRALLPHETTAGLTDDAGPGGVSPGIHPDTAALASVLARRLVSPLSGAPLSEAMILGIGGGLGAGYILWEFKAHGSPIITLGFRNQWQYPAIPGWLGKTLDRLAIPAELHETGGAVRARQTLDRLLAGGDPAIAFIDQQSIGTWGQPDSLAGRSGYPVVVTGRTADGAYLIDDRSRQPLVVPASVLATARGRIGSFKHRLIVPRPAAGGIAGDTLRSAIQDGLSDQVDHLRSSSDSFSLPTWRKWSRLLTDTRNAKAWPRVFADGRGLLGALLSIIEAVDDDIGAYGGNLRDLYADFLDEATTALDRPALAEAANRWRAIADLWRDLADAAIPVWLPGASEAVEAAEDLRAAVSDGEPGRGRADSAARALWAIRERPDGGALSADSRAELFAELGQRIGAIYAAEKDALEATAAASGR
ncbi:MAG TPA: DUF4872 domain-containing protein [Candidatus Limnocylindrales bacterium]|jgi:hypothetical protein